MPTSTDWLNHHHLYYFWLIAQEGSLTRAAARLHVTHSTLSEQLRLLEAALGQELFERRGRRLVLTAFGQDVAQYAGDIFRLSSELLEVARGRHRPRSALRVGVLAALPRTIIYRMLVTSLEDPEQPTLEVVQGDLPGLLTQLAAHRLHVVLADQPASVGADRPLDSQLLGETGVLLYASQKTARRYAEAFPGSLDGAPLLLPARGSRLRLAIDRWLVAARVRPRVVAEFNDAGLLRAFGAHGAGLFPVRSVLARELEETHRVALVGELAEIREQYYAVWARRRARHDGVALIVDAARRRLLAPG